MNKGPPSYVAPLPMKGKKPGVVDYSCACASWLNANTLLSMVSWGILLLSHGMLTPELTKLAKANDYL